MDSPRSATHQAQEDPAVQSTDSIETDEMEASNVRLLCLAYIVGFPYLYTQFAQNDLTLKIARSKVMVYD